MQTTHCPRCGLRHDSIGAVDQLCAAWETRMLMRLPHGEVSEAWNRFITAKIAVGAQRERQWAARMARKQPKGDA